MKWILSLAIACSLLFLGCKKEDNNDSPNIQGAWKYIGYSGGLAGLQFVPVNNKSSYIQFQNNQFIIVDSIQQKHKCMQYRFQETPQNANAYLNGILTLNDTTYLFPNENAQLFDAAIAADTLALYPRQCADCFVSYYKHSEQQFSCSAN